MPLLRRPLFSILGLLLSGCAVETAAVDELDEAADPETGVSANAALDGTPDAIGVLALLNHPSTNLDVLDNKVPLEKRAAENLLARRNGADQTPGTADDVRFLSIADADAVAYVGPVALDALTAYANLAEFVPSGSDLLGTWDDVPFTADAALTTLDLVSTASYEVLDTQVPLDARAVDAIFAARPIETILELSGLYYVGPSALLHIRDFTTAVPVGGVGSDCALQADCNGGLKCTGKPSEEDPAPQIGKCVDMTDLPGEEERCSAIDPCNPGLICAGETLPYMGGQGYCRAAWQEGTFTSTTSMPLAHGVPTVSNVVVYGLATVPEDIWLTLDIDHPRPQDLVVTLRHQNGSSAVVYNHAANPEATIQAPGGVERDAYVNGTWSCEVVDTVTGQTGSLKGFSLKINSRWD